MLICSRKVLVKPDEPLGADARGVACGFVPDIRITEQGMQI